MRLKYECRHHAVSTGFYSTYKELKQKYREENLNLYEWVFIVPIRN